MYYKQCLTIDRKSLIFRIGRVCAWRLWIKQKCAYLFARKMRHFLVLFKQCDLVCQKYKICIIVVIFAAAIDILFPPFFTVNHTACFPPPYYYLSFRPLQIAFFFLDSISSQQSVKDYSWNTANIWNKREWHAKCHRYSIFWYDSYCKIFEGSFCKGTTIFFSKMHTFS